MGTTDTTARHTLVELTRRTLNKEVLEIAEVLAEYNDFIDDGVWQQANQTFSHKHVRRSSLPSGSYRKLNSGVAVEASVTEDIVEDIGMLETYSEIDKEIVMANADPAQYRWNEDKAFLEGLSQTFGDTFVYGSRAAAPEKINGLDVRYALLANGNVWGAGGTGSALTSLWVVSWGLNQVFFVYPLSSKTVGIEFQDLGEVTLYDGNSLPFQGYRGHFVTRHGLVIRNDRCIQRVCNIMTTGTSNIFDPKILVRALNHMPKGGKKIIYVNETLKSQMDNNAMDKTNAYYTIGEIYGREQTQFRGVPIHRIDQILDTETALE